MFLSRLTAALLSTLLCTRKSAAKNACLDSSSPIYKCTPTDGMWARVVAGVGVFRGSVFFLARPLSQETRSSKCSCAAPGKTAASRITLRVCFCTLEECIVDTCSEASCSHARTIQIQRSLLRSLRLTSCGISDSDHDDLADCISVAAGQETTITTLWVRGVSTCPRPLACPHGYAKYTLTNASKRMAWQKSKRNVYNVFTLAHLSCEVYPRIPLLLPSSISWKRTYILSGLDVISRCPHESGVISWFRNMVATYVNQESIHSVDSGSLPGPSGPDKKSPSLTYVLDEGERGLINKQRHQP